MLSPSYFLPISNYYYVYNYEFNDVSKELKELERQIKLKLLLNEQHEKKSQGNG
jgi:hypothetical protein